MPFVLTPTIILYGIGGLTALLLLILIIWVSRLAGRVKRLLIGKNAKTLEDSINQIVDNLKELKQFTVDMEAYLTTVEKRLKKSVQGIETVRFNPFKGTGSGGNQSFATAFVNEHGDGVVLTSMYSRDRISMFAKPLKNFASEFELSEEEVEDIEKSKKSLSS